MTTYRAPSGQIWTELYRSDDSIELAPEYPCGKREVLVLRMQHFESLGWKRVEDESMEEVK